MLVRQHHVGILGLMIALSASAGCDSGLDQPTPGTIELGMYEVDGYRPLRDGDACLVGPGIQGGTWTMPALRLIEGIASHARLECSLDTETGERVGWVSALVRFTKAEDGIYEIRAMLLEVKHAPPRDYDPIDDLFGLEATLSCWVRDGQGHEAEASVELVIVETDLYR